MARIDAELTAVARVHPAAPFSVQEYRERLASLRAQMFGGGGSDGTTMVEGPLASDVNGSNMEQRQSPVRNRLESPAAKFARVSGSNSASGPGSPLHKATNTHRLVDDGDGDGRGGAEKPPADASTISSLRERLARLKNEHK